MRLVVACYIRRRDDWWEAVCPKLNFAATGYSFLDAHERLGRRIQDYIKYVETLPEQDRLAFYDRRPSLWARLSLGSSAILAALCSRPGHKGGNPRIMYTFEFAT